MIPLWVIRYVLPGVGAVLALWAAYSWADGRGYDRADAKWRKAESAAVAAAQAKSAAMQAQVDAAGAALSEQAAAIDRLTHVQKVNTRTFYVQNPAANVACLLPDRLRAVAESDAAAAAAIAAK
jgi:hypothetical protein